MYAVDCPSIPRFFKGRDMGIKNKTVRFENIHIPTPTGSSDIRHVSGNEMFVFDNSDSYMFTENYNLMFNDLFVGGKAVKL